VSKRGVVVTALFVLLVAGAVAGFLLRRRHQHLAATAEAYESLRQCLYRSPLGSAEKPSDRLVAIDLCDRTMASLDTCQTELEAAVSSWGDLGVDTSDARFGRAIDLSRRAYAPEGTPSRWLSGDERPLIDELEDALARADLPPVERVETSAPCLAPAKFSTSELTPLDDELGYFGDVLPPRSEDRGVRVEFRESEVFGSRRCTFVASGPATVDCSKPSTPAPDDAPPRPQELATTVHAKRIENVSSGSGFVVFSDDNEKTFVATHAAGRLGTPIPLAAPASWSEVLSCPSERGPVLAMIGQSAAELRVFYPKDGSRYDEPLTLAQPFGDGAGYSEGHGSGPTFVCSPSGVPRWAWRETGTFLTVSCPRSGCVRGKNVSVFFPLRTRDLQIVPFGEDRVLLVMQEDDPGRFAEHVLTVRARTGTIETVSNGRDTVLWGKLSNMGTSAERMQAFAFGDAAWAMFRVDGKLRAVRTRSDVNGFEIVHAP